MSIIRKIQCPTCEGDGQSAGLPCFKCDGSGKIDMVTADEEPAKAALMVVEISGAHIVKLKTAAGTVLYVGAAETREKAQELADAFVADIAPHLVQKIARLEKATYKVMDDLEDYANKMEGNYHDRYARWLREAVTELGAGVLGNG